MPKLRYANTEIDFSVERLVEIAQMGIDGLRSDDEDSALEYFADTMELTEYEARFFGINPDEMQTYSRYYDGEEFDDEDEFDDSDAWEDDSDRGCKDCPPDECTGHCMSCWYRPV